MNSITNSNKELRNRKKGKKNEKDIVRQGPSIVRTLMVHRYKIFIEDIKVLSNNFVCTEKSI